MKLCCLKVNGFWKVHFWNGKEWERLNTHCNEDAFECCPTAEWNDGKWVISFISGGSVKDDWKDVEFWLYKKYGLDDSEPIKIAPADVGYIWKCQIVFANKKGPIHLFEYGNELVIHLRDIQFIYRLNYNPFNPRELLISAETNDGKLISFSYDYFLDEVKMILDGSSHCYKCALWFDKQIYYCKKNPSDEFEDRHIVKATMPRFLKVPTDSLIEKVDVNHYETEEGLEDGM